MQGLNSFLFKFRAYSESFLLKLKWLLPCLIHLLGYVFPIALLYYNMFLIFSASAEADKYFWWCNKPTHHTTPDKVFSDQIQQNCKCQKAFTLLFACSTVTVCIQAAFTCLLFYFVSFSSIGLSLACHMLLPLISVLMSGGITMTASEFTVRWAFIVRKYS